MQLYFFLFATDTVKMFFLNMKYWLASFLKNIFSAEKNDVLFCSIINIILLTISNECLYQTVYLCLVGFCTIYKRCFSFTTHSFHFLTKSHINAWQLIQKGSKGYRSPWRNTGAYVCLRSNAGETSEEPLTPLGPKNIFVTR